MCSQICAERVLALLIPQAPPRLICGMGGVCAARKWEKAYMEDMESLGVKDPDVMTRVTEYVPKIIAL
eukprot:COSAG01_NODE_16169_length_1263_cov_1.450172_3_plen_68_part_00